ncbi:MAG TPA: flagellar biosynthesis anti-sigma factor FlgM [Rubrivivax sp.]|nr:flagellar biosynthesis anti-sigma factor FlgM [Burkholderiales bacterium]HNT37781.1 flagellar biosynthesis anti-sigma factor FlgM [Rubrivivax sp.]
MKIVSPEKTLPVKPSNPERKTPANAQAAAGSPAAADGSTKVAISSKAAALAAGSDGSFDAAKVERVGQAIKDGSYRIDAEVIADKLIANAQELLGRGSR